MSETHEVVVVGGAQAGLSAAYELRRAGVDCVVLEGGARIGDAWRRRWDSLTLFTPAEYSALPGLPFPAPRGHYPTRGEMADYLELYAATYALDVRLGEQVSRVARVDDAFEVRTSTGAYRARCVVVATGPFHVPTRPSFAQKLGAGVRQLHSAEYRAPADVGDGPVVVVGGGNSGVQIADELAASGRDTTLCIGTRGRVLPERVLGRSIFWWLEKVGYMDVPVDSRIGRRLSQGQVIIGESPRAVAKRTGLRVEERAVDAGEAAIVTRRGTRLPAQTVIWATGFRPDFSWIDAPVCDEKGAPVHRRGVTSVPGLYFLGLSWLHTRGSALVGWVGRDAQWLAKRIRNEVRTDATQSYATV